jgi:hypothetical protein
MKNIHPLRTLLDLSFMQGTAVVSSIHKAVIREKEFRGLANGKFYFEFDTPQKKHSFLAVIDTHLNKLGYITAPTVEEDPLGKAPRARHNPLKIQKVKYTL